LLSSSSIGVAPAEKKIGEGPNLQGKVVSAHPQGECAPPGRARVEFLEEIGQIWTVVVVNLVVLARVLRATTKKVVNYRVFWAKKSAPQRKSWLRQCPPALKPIVHYFFQDI